MPLSVKAAEALTSVPADPSDPISSLRPVSRGCEHGRAGLLCERREIRLEEKDQQGQVGPISHGHVHPAQSCMLRDGL